MIKHWMIQIQRKSLQIFTHIDRIPVQYKLMGGGGGQKNAHTENS